MHELSLAQSVLQQVESASNCHDFSRVTLLRLEVGQLSGVEVSSLRFSLENISSGSILSGAHILIEEPPGKAWCMRCCATINILKRGDCCPSCGSFQMQPTDGLQLRIVDIEVI